MARRLIPHLHRVMVDNIISTSKANATILLPEKTIKVGWITQFWNHYSTKSSEVRSRNSSYSVMEQSQILDQYTSRENTSSEGQDDNESVKSKRDTGGSFEDHIGRNVSKKDKIKFLVNTLLGLKESREAVYGALDAWVAWEERFPIASLRIALGTLEKEQEWHKVIQVIKWILSKGQGNTMGIYRQLINALDMDHRPEEAHNFWMKKIGTDLHSVPWQLCTLMISIYYRNNMLERLVKLFKGLEAFDRKPPDKLVVQKVADAYEVLGLVKEKNRVLEKYNNLFMETWMGVPKNSKKAARKELKKSAYLGEKKQRGTSSDQQCKMDVTPLISSDQQSTKDDVQVACCNQQSNTISLTDKLREMIFK